MRRIFSSLILLLFLNINSTLAADLAKYGQYLPSHQQKALVKEGKQNYEILERNLPFSTEIELSKKPAQYVSAGEIPPIKFFQDKYLITYGNQDHTQLMIWHQADLTRRSKRFYLVEKGREIRCDADGEYLYICDAPSNLKHSSPLEREQRCKQQRINLVTGEIDTLSEAIPVAEIVEIKTPKFSLHYNSEKAWLEDANKKKITNGLPFNGSTLIKTAYSPVLGAHLLFLQKSCRYDVDLMFISENDDRKFNNVNFNKNYQKKVDNIVVNSDGTVIAVDTMDGDYLIVLNDNFGTYDADQFDYLKLIDKLKMNGFVEKEKFIKEIQDELNKNYEEATTWAEETKKKFSKNEKRILSHLFR